MTLEELEIELLKIPKTGAVNKARRAAIIKEILRLLREGS